MAANEALAETVVSEISSLTAASSADKDSAHYVFFQHGIWGDSGDFEVCREVLARRPGIVCVPLVSNEHKTTDGVEMGGKRCANEITKHLETLPKGSQISFFCHSLGGIYVRYALRQIYQTDKHFMSSRGLKCRLLIFIASPHAGIGCSAWYIRIPSRLPVFKTTRDMLLKSSTLVDLCDQDGIQALLMFEKRILYGNISCDEIVGPRTSLLLSDDTPVPIHPFRRQRSASEPLALMSPRRLKSPIVEELLTAKSEEPELELDFKLGKRSSVVEKRLSILHTLNQIAWTRYGCHFTPRLGGPLKGMDCSAHVRIICHGTKDKERVGMPVLEHMCNLWSSGATPRHSDVH